MKIFLLLMIPFMLLANVYYAKVEPFLTTTIKASVAAEVLYVDVSKEGKLVNDNRTVILLDDTLDKIQLASTKKRFLFLEESLKINQEILQNLVGSKERQAAYYRRMNQLKTASQTQKDNAYASYISIATQYLNTKEKIVNLQRQIVDMQDKQAQLEESIAKKNLNFKTLYLYKLMVHAGDFVAPGTPLAKVQDMHQAKLVIYLEPEMLKNIQNRIIYIDSKQTDYRVSKVWRVADEKFISLYRAEIYIDAPQNYFSKLLKIEIK